MFSYIFAKKRNIHNILKSYYSSNNKLTNNIYDNNMYNTSKAGPIRHYPPAVRIWNNSVFNFNKNSIDNSFTKYDRLDKIIKSYFNLHNDIKLARSKRMRYLRIKSISKRLFISKPEVKQTNDKIIITVYYFDKLNNNFTRKNYFYNRPSIVKHILNLKIRNRRLKYKVKLFNKHIKHLGIKQIKELKSFKDINKFKNKYLEQSLWLYFFKYLLSLINIQIYNPILISSNLINRINKRNIHKYLKLIIRKEMLKISKIIKSNPKTLYWININNYSIETIEYPNINSVYLKTKIINDYNILIKNIFKNKNNLIKLNFISEINKKLFVIINNYYIKNILSESITIKIYNYLSLKVYKNISKKMFYKQYNKISKLTYLSMNKNIKFKNILPALKTVIDTFYNKKTELNMVNLKYFYMNSDIFTQALILKLKKKVSPRKVITRAMSKVKVFLDFNVRKQVMLNNMDKLHEYSNLSLNSFPKNAINNNIQSSTTKDWIQIIFNKLFPNNLLQKYNKSKSKFNNKITNILNNIKYKGILGIRIEAKGRLTRRHKAARALSHVIYKGSLKDNEWYYNEEENFERSKSALLLRNDVKANTQYMFKSSIRRIGSFGIKTWISSK